MNGMHPSTLFHGSSLVEVLVTLVLLTLGLLGASLLHVSSLRARHESALASSAAQLAASIAERLRGNSTARDAYLGIDITTDDSAPADGAAPACHAGAGCSALQLAQFDLADWRMQLRTALPGARLRICRDLPVASAFADELTWDCSGGTGAPVVIKLGWRGRLAAAASPNSAGAPKLVWQVAGGAP